MLVDVILPVFNTSIGYVREALRSLLAQSVTEWNAWVVNDASGAEYTETLISLIKELDDPRIHYLWCEHKGPSGSRNVGIAAGSALYVAFLDSDDCWNERLLARHLERFRREPECAMVHGHFELIDASGARLHPTPPNREVNRLDSRQQFAAMLRENYVSTSSVVIRRDSLESVGGFNETYPCLVDKELWLRLLADGAKFIYVEDVVFAYRLHPNNISKNTALVSATRKRLIDDADQMIREKRLMDEGEWRGLRRDMMRSMHEQAALGYLAQENYRKAVEEVLPWRAGLTLSSSRILLKALANMAAGGQEAGENGGSK